LDGRANSPPHVWLNRIGSLFRRARSINLGPFLGFLPMVWFPELPTSDPEVIPSQLRAIPSVRSFCRTPRESTGGKGRTGAEFRTIRILMNSRLFRSRFRSARSLDGPQKRIISFQTLRRRQVPPGLWWGAMNPRDRSATVLNVRIRPRRRISRASATLPRLSAFSVSF
jgi:hypothetical protein